MTDSKLTIAIQLQKSFGRHGTYKAAFGPIVGYGKTQAEAKQSLSENLLAALAASSVDPAFARDDDGSLIVALPNHAGVIHWRVGDGEPRAITGCDGPPRKSLETVPHYTVLGSTS